MEQYQYQALDSKKEEIRLLHLHPSTSDDPIRLSISHVSFHPSMDHEGSSHAEAEKLQAVRDNLPEAWTVFKTLESKTIYYCNPGRGEEYSSWSLPPGTHIVLPSKATDIIQKHHPGPNYEAVSYSWGCIDNPVDVEIVSSHLPSESSSGRLKVGPNLLDMLLQLRLETSLRTLWIDAICINQQDLAERSEQIKRMYDIFSLADRVVVWLGKASEDSLLALQTLEYVGKQLEYTSDDHFLPAPNSRESNWWHPEHRIDLSSEAWSAIAHLIQRPYFERLWILQEIQLANQHSQVQCGEVTVPWYYLRRAFIRCRYEQATVPQLSEISLHIRLGFVDQLSRDLKAVNIKWLLDIATGRKCSNPRDRVFALLGMFPSSLAQRVQSDYSAPVEQVYIQTSLATIDIAHRLILLGAMRRDDPNENRPSWAPDFTYQSYEPFSSFDAGLATSYSAAHLVYHPPKQLHVLGILEDQVNTIAPESTVGMGLGYRAVNGLASIISQRSTKEQILDAYMWLLTQGKLRERWYDYAMVPTLEEAKVIFQQEWEGDQPVLNESYRDWYATIMAKQKSRRFFITEKGCLGCTDLAIEPGDKLSVILGYDMPVLLRPSPDNVLPLCYKVVGAVYVHGLMDGESVLGQLPSTWNMVLRVHPNFEFCFVNIQTGEETREDPRLDALPEEWEIIEKEDEVRLWYRVQHYRTRKQAR